MDVAHSVDDAVSRIAAAIGEPARARMLYCLLDDRARTSTELALVAGVSPSTASVHLNRLKAEELVQVVPRGKHYFYSLTGPDVANVLEGLSFLAGAPRDAFVSSAPSRLRAARTCYDHLAGALGVALHDRLTALGWLSIVSTDTDTSYDVTPTGRTAFKRLGIEVEGLRMQRRRFAFPCLDWSERRSHLGGALGAALSTLALRKRWVARDLDSRALRVTALGRRDLLAQFGLQL
jgi:DNA-binding transcriptional ArsR family regulator